eukprot:1159687-Pelagomonas_calceolata.AAC.2
MGARPGIGRCNPQDESDFLLLGGRGWRDKACTLANMLGVEIQQVLFIVMGFLALKHHASTNTSPGIVQLSFVPPSGQ